MSSTPTSGTARGPPRGPRPPLDALRPPVGAGAPPIIVRGEGCRIVGRGGPRPTSTASRACSPCRSGTAAASWPRWPPGRPAELAFFPLWSYAHPAAIDLAERLAHYAPGDLNRVFFTSGGGEAVEAAWKLAKQYFKLIGKPLKTKVISRSIAYHGTTQGALAITGVTEYRAPFEPLVPGRVQGAQHQRLPRARTTSRTRRSGCGRPTASRRRSSPRAPTPWPRCSSSPCRTRAAASRPRPATSSGSARSAPATTCCWSPTR